MCTNNNQLTSHYFSFTVLLNYQSNAVTHFINFILHDTYYLNIKQFFVFIELYNYIHSNLYEVCSIF